MKYSPPELIKPAHDLETFDCGNPTLNDWLKKRAIEGEASGASRTYVVCDRNQVVAYYCLASGSIIHASAPGKIKRNMPDPIPVMVLARLAVDINHQRKGIGKGLVKDALLRTLQASEIAGIRAILVHAVDEKAKKFYIEECGFIPSPVHPLTLMLLLGDVKKSLG